MAVSTETTAVVASASGWLAGVVAVLSETSALFERSPLLGFMFMGLLGGFTGWALLIEIGKLDGQPVRSYLAVLGRRLIMGFAFGFAGGLLWMESDGGSRGLWMLVAGIVAAAPVAMFRAGIDVVITIIKSKADGTKG